MALKNTIRRINTSILTINPDRIDWDLFNKHRHIVRYQMPKRGWKEKTGIYFARMHNWYKDHSEYPCYFFTHGPELYVAYPEVDCIVELQYEGKPLRYETLTTPVSITDRAWPHLLKVLVSDYFHKYEAFVSNTDFYLRVDASVRDFISALKIKIQHDWRNPHRFFFIDEAQHLRRLRPEEISEKRNWQYGNYYGLFYQDKSTVFKQLKSCEARNPDQQQAGIYVSHSSQRNPARVTYHSIKTAEAHSRSRTAILNQFFAHLLEYMYELGLPFELLELEMHQVKAESKSQSSLWDSSSQEVTIHMVDDRLAPEVLGPDDYAVTICKLANSLYSKANVRFMLAHPETLNAGDYVLRLQDYCAQDFEDTIVDGPNGDQVIQKKALLGTIRSEDPYRVFKQNYPQLIRQSLILNDAGELDDEKQNLLTPASYLDYKLPGEKQLELKLAVCLNQLVLKDVVQGRRPVVSVLPQAELMTETMFLWNETLLYFDGEYLQFIPVTGANLSTAEKAVGDRCGWDLIDDVLVKAAEYHTFNKSSFDPADRKTIEKTLKRRFIIHRDYILEIEDVNSRMLYHDQTIGRRLAALETKLPIEFFRPRFPLPEGVPFTEDQLRRFDDFLAEIVREPYLSFNELKYRYGKHIRDAQGKIVEEGGFFSLLGIKADQKFKQYIRANSGVEDFISPKGNDVIPIYNNVWYCPNERSYVVGGKQGYKFDQERGHVLRQVICHNPNLDDRALHQLLLTDVFPMMMVEFVRHKNYTVYPFPFNLIKHWQDWQKGLTGQPD